MNCLPSSSCPSWLSGSAGSWPGSAAATSRSHVRVVPASPPVSAGRPRIRRRRFVPGARQCVRRGHPTFSSNQARHRPSTGRQRAHGAEPASDGVGGRSGMSRGAGAAWPVTRRTIWRRIRLTSSAYPELRPATAAPQSRPLCAHEIGKPASAVRTPESQVDQRHVATAGVDQRLQISIAPVAAGLAPDEDAHVAGSQRGPWCRELAEVVAHRLHEWQADPARTWRQRWKRTARLPFPTVTCGGWRGRRAALFHNQAEAIAATIDATFNRSSLRLRFIAPQTPLPGACFSCFSACARCSSPISPASLPSRFRRMPPAAIAAM